MIRVEDNPALADQIGHDIITSDGTTLLGADNKAGLAEIMDAARYLIANPQIPHGTIKILFTPDEEIGRGVDKVDLTKLGADFAYTMDGETAGHLEDETFSADGAVITIEGVSAHPGFAKGKDGARHQDRRSHRRAAAERPLFAGDHRGQGRFSASDRHHRRAGESHAELHRAGFHRRRPRRKKKRCCNPSSTR